MSTPYERLNFAGSRAIGPTFHTPTMRAWRAQQQRIGQDHESESGRAPATLLRVYGDGTVDWEDLDSAGDHWVRVPTMQPQQFGARRGVAR
jgi:hypothetical protein